MHCLNKAMHIVSWCNGSTADSGSVCLGSNPSETTNKQKQTCISIRYAGFLFQGDYWGGYNKSKK